MTAIPASSAGVRDMADQSLRITFEFEPRYAKEAFALFGARGTAAALVALKDGYAAVQEAPQAKAKPGPLCREAVDLCKSEDFRAWLSRHDGKVCSEAGAADHMRHALGVESRRELDTDSEAGRRFVNEIRVPYLRRAKVTA